MQLLAVQAFSLHPFSQSQVKKVNTQWRERFDFNQFPDTSSILEIEVVGKEGRRYEECYGQ